MTADSVARVALTMHLVTSSHVAELTRMLASAPSRDEVELLGELAELTPRQVRDLRVETIKRRAARTFALEQGAYLFEDKICLPVRGAEVDIRAIVYYGVLHHFNEQRLAAEMRAFSGAHIALEPHASEELHRFGFDDADWPILAGLREVSTLPELEARYREIDPRTMRAVIYSLVACGTARVIAPARAPTPRAPLAPIALGRTPTPGGQAPLLNVPASTRDIERISPSSTRDLDRMPAIARTKTNPELAAEAAERAKRALAADNVEAAVLELKKAVELAPNEVDYSAMLGWAIFCAADDKFSVAAETKKLLEKALHRTNQPHVMRFYLGRVARMLGHDKEALGHFHAVLLMQPNHRDASAEVRVIEARLRRSN